MAFTYSPKIVTDGLVLYLDAGNPYSYVSGSTVWNDLSRSQVSGSLINGPTFSTGSGGSIIFDGVNDYGLLEFSFSGYEGTFDYWVRTTNTGSYLFVANKGSLTANPNLSNGITIITPDYNTGSVLVYLNNSTGVNKTAIQALSSTNIRNGNWYNITVTLGYIASTSSLSLYLNGVLQNSQSRTLDYLDFFNLTNTYYLAAQSPTLARSQMDIANHKIYNRALSSQEVLQNYNATKGRFGLI